MHEATRNLRQAERYLLAPPLAARFGTVTVAVCDISASGARFRHHEPVESGSKAILQIASEARAVNLEAIVVWTQPDREQADWFISGVRTYGPPEVMQSLISQLQTSSRTSRIEELRSTDRFHVVPPLAASYGRVSVAIEDLSARGARIEVAQDLVCGSTTELQFAVPGSAIEVTVAGQVMWKSLKAVTGDAPPTYRAGLLIREKGELMRLAIGMLCEMNRAAPDMHSLRLKLRVIRARARQLAPDMPQIEAAGIPAEQYLLIQGVREELRLNPEEAMHWYGRARLSISDPAIRTLAPPIADHPDALAVWEYLERSVDPSIVSRAFRLS